MIRYFSKTAIFLALPIGLAAQETTISLYDAVTIALERNYDVRTASLSRAIDDNNAEIGNAGLLPTVYLAGSGSYANSDVETTFNNPEQPPIVADGATTIGYSGSANLEYLLFNGGKRMHILNQLQSIGEDGRLNERLSLENTTLNVSNNFLEVVRLQDQVVIDQETVNLSLDRLDRASQNFQFGNTTRLVLLNAEVDLRTDSINLAQSQVQYSRALRNLYLSMGVAADTTLGVNGQFDFAELLDRQAILDQALGSNTNYLRTRNNLYAAEEGVKAQKAELFPVLSANAAYQYNYTDYEANFLNTQQNSGLSAGLGLRFYVFDGRRIRRNIENAELERGIAEVSVERSRNQVVQLVNNAYDTYITNLSLLQISQRNVSLAELNYERSAEAFATGQITGIELRDAQLNLSNSKNAISRQRVVTKLSEIGLLYEAGLLVK